MALRPSKARPPPLLEDSPASANAEPLATKHFGYAVSQSPHAARPGGKYFSILEPMSDAERLLVSERIRRDITESASAILRHEQDMKRRLHTVHIKSISLVILAVCALGYAMIYLQGVLVPFTLAIFFMFLLEPLLFLLLRLPMILGRAVPIFRPVALRMEEQKRIVRLSNRMPRDDFSDGPGSPRSPSKLSRDQNSVSDTSPAGDASSLEGMRTDIGIQPNCGDHGRKLMQAMTWRVWSLVSVLLCLTALLAGIGLVVMIAVRSLESFSWKKYENSENLRMVLDDWFPHIGADPKNLQLESFMPWLVQGFLVDAIDFTFRMISMAFLTFLFLGFLLASDVEFTDVDDTYGLAHKVRISVRRYIRIKSTIAFVVTLLIWLIYWAVEVDLAFMFGILTFVLSYIPHVGYTIAVLAPLPIVFLDPTKSWEDVAIVFIFPFIIHQFASNLIEPKLLASSLDLHPIVVLLALAFWTTVWGAVGAILSVPLTAVVRLILLEVDHPYTHPIVNLLKGRLQADPLQQTSKFSKRVQLSEAAQAVAADASPRAESPPSPNCPSSSERSDRGSAHDVSSIGERSERGSVHDVSSAEARLADVLAPEEDSNRQLGPLREDGEDPVVVTL